MRSGKAKKRPTAIWLVTVFWLLGAAATIDLSTPERTVETYYLGYKTGDKTIITQTMLRKDVRISDLGLGVDQKYQIVAKKRVLESKLFAKPGDIEIITDVTVKWPEGPVEMITTFILREVNKQWKIAGYHSEKPGAKGPD